MSSVNTLKLNESKILSFGRALDKKVVHILYIIFIYTFLYMECGKCLYVVRNKSYCEQYTEAVTNVHLTHYQTTNFRLSQTERVSRRQFQI